MATLTLHSGPESKRDHRFTRAAKMPRPVAINSAFLQEIKDSNPEYWHWIGELQSCLGKSPEGSSARMTTEDFKTVGQRCDRLRRTLDQFRDCAAMHFSLEESYGYVSLAEPIDPPLCRLCAITRGEHSTLFLELTDLAEEAEELQYRGADREQLQLLVDQTKRFEARLMAHESAEKTLISQARNLK